MQKAGKLIHAGLLTAWDGFWVVWLSEVLWAVFVLPVVTAPLAFAGLYECANALAYGESASWRSFFSGIRHHFGAGFRWTIFNLGVILTLAFYVAFLSPSAKNLNDILSGPGVVPVILLSFWWALNQFTYPFMLVQQKPAYLTALRNSLVLFIKWPGVALGFTLFNLAVIVVCTLLRFPWLFFGASLPALMACLCVKYSAEQNQAAANAITENKK